MEFLSVNERYGIDHDMIMNALCVHMSCYNDLKSLAPHLLCQLHSDRMSFIGSDLTFFEALISMEGNDAISFTESQLDSIELISGTLDCTVDPRCVIEFFSLVLICSIGYKVSEPLLL